MDKSVCISSPVRLRLKPKFYRKTRIVEGVLLHWKGVTECTRLLGVYVEMEGRKEMSTQTFRIDIDGTIARPKFFHDDFQECMALYIQAGIVRPEEIGSLTYHQQVFLLPHVLITHRPIEGAVAALQHLARKGRTLQYFTVRQNFDKDICQQVHEQTKVWLRKEGFPNSQTSFFWDPAKKLI